MKDFLLKLGNGERYQSVAIIVCIALAIWMFGCESQTKSLIHENEMVSRSQLLAELNYLQSSAEARLVELNQQDELKNSLFEHALIAGSTGQINPLLILTSFGAIFGLGATVDNVRKRKEVKKLKNGGNG